MNFLDEQIDRAYFKYQEELAQQQQAQKLKEQQEIEGAIAAFKTELDKALAPQLQQGTGIELILDARKVAIAHFTYKDTHLCILQDSTSTWSIWKHDQLPQPLYASNLLQYAAHQTLKSEDLTDALLIELGKIRDYQPKIDPKEVQEIQNILGHSYTAISAIITIPAWEKLIEKDEELKSYLANTLTYISEATGCIEGITEGSCEVNYAENW